VTFQPTELRHIRATLSLSFRALETGYLFHSVFARSRDEQQWQLQSRQPFVFSAQELLGSDFDFGVKQTSDFQSNLLQSIEKQNIHILGKSSFESRKTNDRARSELKCA